jgi:hypothetical protein
VSRFNITIFATCGIVENGHPREPIVTTPADISEGKQYVLAKTFNEVVMPNPGRALDPSLAELNSSSARVASC